MNKSMVKKRHCVSIYENAICYKTHAK